MKRVFVAMLATTCLALSPAAARAQEAAAPAPPPAAPEGTREARLKAHEERIRKIVEDRKARQLVAREQEAVPEQSAAAPRVRLLVARNLGVADANAFVQVMRSDGYATAKVGPERGERGRYLVYIENLPEADAGKVFEGLQRDGYSLPSDKIEELIQPQPAPVPPLTVAFNPPVTLPPVTVPPFPTPPVPPDVSAEETIQLDDDLSSPPAERRVTIAVSNAEAGHALSRLAAAAHTRILARGSVADTRTSILTRQQPLGAVLEQVAAENDWVLVSPGELSDAFELWRRNDYTQQVLPKRVKLRVLEVREISVEEASKALSILATPGLGRAVLLPNSRQIVVSDLPEVLDACEALLKQVDKKPATPPPDPAAAAKP